MAGIAHLVKEISATARHRKIPKNQIFLGSKDEAAYVANFTEALRAKGYLVVRVNAFEAKENRENLLASTDALDLLGIANTLLSRRARLTGDGGAANPAYHHLREITRFRRSLVRQQTAASNRIHALADQLFPAFLIKGLSLCHSENIIKDQIIVLQGKHKGMKLRRVEAWVEVDGKWREMVFMTNNTEWSPRSVCDLYRRR